MDTLKERLAEIFQNRLAVMLLVVAAVFIILVCRLFNMQIVNGEEANTNLTASVTREVTIPAARGNIYDRYGRPLATNKAAFSVEIDDSIAVEYGDREEQVRNLADELRKNGYSIADTLPITKENPYEYTLAGDELSAWKTSIGLGKKQLDMTVNEVLSYLFNEYKLDKTSMTDEQKREVVSLGLNISNKNIMLISLIMAIETNGGNIVDELPISTTQPYSFIIEDKDEIEKWKKDVSMKDDQLQYTAEESMDYLIDLFDIPKNISQGMQRKLAAVRYSEYLQRYKKYQPVTVAREVNEKIIASVQENLDIYPGVSIETESMRVYDDGEIFSNIIGYIRQISDSELNEYKKYGYTSEDIVGKTGIEKGMELDLNGQDGTMLVEVDNMGRKISTLETKTPVSGKDVYLTIDKDLQASAYNYLENSLAEAIITRLTTTEEKDVPVTMKQLFTSMINSSNISISKIMKAEDGYQLILKDLILAYDKDIDISNTDDKTAVKQVLCNAVDDGTISYSSMIYVMIEQGVITVDEDYRGRILSGQLSPFTVVIDKLKSGDLTPAETGLDPCTGSVVVSDVNSGQVLALVTYPSYDNNQLVNTFNNEYYNKLLEDPATPLVNRPLMQKKAPGSTLKMVTAIAGLESGAIDTTTTIKDEGLFTKTGTPYARCWLYSLSGATHGYVDVRHALEVSCNYFFYNVGYLLGGDTENPTSLKGITILDEYMDAFGLNSKTGVEINENAPTMASPSYKEEVVKWQNPEATSSQTRWTSGDTIRAAIGQSVNSFTAASMNKYIATLANGGTRYKMHLLDSVRTSDGTVVSKTEEEIENVIDVKQEYLDAVYEGMKLVTKGSSGTLRNVFKDYPIDIAAKSGTAEENKNKSSHVWFVGFAPYDDPQIAVTVMIPFGDVTGSPAAVVAKNIIGEYMGLNYSSSSDYMENHLSE
ncbi:MAG: penicillin-binding transpeptidase domain-containing protein [Candidatus Metalachnospira sp.]|nr:penicillin-binding transpeptidase domain-containing protein [Candidatus Metalachnospira sp.]